MYCAVFIAGGGFYGSKAVEALRGRGLVVVADVSRSCSARRYVDCVVDDLDEIDVERCSAVLVLGDAAEVLLKIIEKGFVPEIIVPTVPRHLAGDFIALYLRRKGFEVSPSSAGLDAVVEELVLHGVEVRLDREQGVVIASYMPFNLRCKPGCTHPITCPVTGKVKTKPLHKLMAEALGRAAERVYIIESKPLAEDVGGFPGRVLLSIAEDIARVGGNIAIATACACHGIANVFNARKA